MGVINQYLQPILLRIPENNRMERIWKLAQVDFKKRYYNDRLGLFWALLNPLLRVAVYYFAFTYLLNRTGQGMDNFALFIFSGLLFWMEFVQIMRRGMKILQQKSYLIMNIQINKFDLYYSLAISSILGFIFNLLAYFIFALVLDIDFSAQLLWLPVIIFTVYLFSLGVSMILSIIFIYIRDIDHIVDIFILLGLWTSGIFFDPKIILDVFPPAYYINPFMGILHNVRAIMLLDSHIDLYILVWDLILALFIFVIGSICIHRYSHLAIERK